MWLKEERHRENNKKVQMEKERNVKKGLKGIEKTLRKFRTRKTMKKIFE